MTVGPALRDVGYGTHVITAMLACFAGGCVAGRSVSKEPGVVYGIGMVGLVGAMLTEVWLFICQTGFPERDRLANFLAADQRLQAQSARAAGAAGAAGAANQSEGDRVPAGMGGAGLRARFQQGETSTSSRVSTNEEGWARGSSSSSTTRRSSSSLTKDRND